MYMHESRLLNCDLDISPLLFQFFHLRDHSLVDFTFCQKARQMNLLRVWHVLTDIVKKYFYPSFTSAVFSELWTEPLLPWTKCTWPFWATDIQLICLEEQPSIIENAFLQIAPPLTLNRLSVSPKIDQELTAFALLTYWLERILSLLAYQWLACSLCSLVCNSLVQFWKRREFSLLTWHQDRNQEDPLHHPEVAVQ